MRKVLQDTWSSPAPWDGSSPSPSPEYSTPDASPAPAADGPAPDEYSPDYPSDYLSDYPSDYPSEYSSSNSTEASPSPAPPTPAPIPFSTMLISRAQQALTAPSAAAPSASPAEAATLPPAAPMLPTAGVTGGNATATAGVCTMAPQTGACRAAITRAYFNQVAGRCEPFVWGGCGLEWPAANNFLTVEECECGCVAGANFTTACTDAAQAAVITSPVEPLANTLMPTSPAAEAPAAPVAAAAPAAPVPVPVTVLPAERLLSTGGTAPAASNAADASGQRAMACAALGGALAMALLLA